MTISSLSSTLKVLAIVLCLFAIYSITPAEAQSIPAGVELDGHAWSSNIGWISLNCQSGGDTGGEVCGTSDYKVRLTRAGNFEGYAWSPSIGWVRFGGLSVFPTGGGTSNDNAKVADSNYRATNILGWIRACAGTSSEQNECGSMGTSTVSGGWDGWISLRGNGYGVNTSNFGTPQYVWGGDVVGWVDMSSNVRWLSPTTMSGTGCEITVEGESTCQGRLNWEFASGTTNPTIVRIAPTSPTIPNLTGATGTNRAVTLQLGSNTFAARSGAGGTNLASRVLTASCDSDAGLVMSDSTSTCELATGGEITILSLVASPTIVRRGGTATISWRLSADPAGQCLLSGPGLANYAITGQDNSYTTNELLSTARFTLDCGSSVDNETITVVPAFNEV